MMAQVAEQMFPGYSSMVLVSSPIAAACGGRIAGDDDDFCDSSVVTSEDSNVSGEDSSSLDFSEDATSSGSSSPAQVVPESDGPIFELSSLMASLPIKRGLSNFYQGKSQSFTSLSEARSVEDLAKRETPYGKRMKTCKSYAGGLHCHRSYAPGAYTRRITKKSSRASSYSSLSGKRNSSFTAARPPTPLARNSNSMMRSHPC
ncbi:hypothetical protein H6P81_000996 [Aristolochia fimbriata]|uniref:Oxidative stress 3 n=1 Tax=Aristolochia fimbriata TaxID=158543 RepID=A0AAV7F5Y6_ARIFI|nr:hypothetical protein H6P81_000996 [Aristolochia fimbriata]